MPSGHRPQPPVGTARVAFSGLTAGAHPWVNVFWLNITATTHAQADLKNVIDSMEVAYMSRMAAYMASTYSLTQGKASWLYASNSVLEYTGSYAGAGTGSSTSATDATCAVIDWSITDYYRGGHPRTYFPGVPAGQIVANSILGTSYQSSLATGASNWINDVNALTHGGISAVALGTVRFASGNAWLSPPVFKGYQGASVRSTLGTQKRRLGGR